MIAAAVTVLAVADDNGDEASTTGVTPLGASGDDHPQAPWRVATVTRAKVPPPYLDAWDRAGNRTYRRNVLGSSAGFDEKYSYDGLYQLSELQRGTLNSGGTAITGTSIADGKAL